MEKLLSLCRPGPRLATQPIIGTVSIGRAPADRLVATNVSPISPEVAHA